MLTKKDPQMKNILILSIALLLSYSDGIASKIPAAQKQPIKIMCGSVGKEFSICKTGVKACSAKLGFAAEALPAVNGSNNRFSLYSQFFAGKSPDISVFQIDVTWPALLESHLIDLSPYVTKKEQEAYIPLLMKNNTIKGKVLALPWFIDVGILYYRKDLLEKYNKPVPKTWEELFKTAEYIQTEERKAGNKTIWGYVFQGKAYEGLTVNVMEWLKSFGTNFFDAKGNITVNSPQAVEALKLFASNIGKTIPKGILNYAEEDARGAFQSGNAVFMRNWPYAYSLSQAGSSKLKGKVGLASLPKGGENGNYAAALGGWQLAVSKYAPDKKRAAAMVKCLTGYDEQKKRAIVGGYTPTMKALHANKDVAGKTTYLKFFGSKIDHFVQRPSRVTGRKYNQISAAIWNAFHKALGQGSTANPEKILNNLEKKIKMLLPKKRNK